MKNIEDEVAQEAEEIQRLLAQLIVSFKRGKEKGLVIMTVNDCGEHRQYISTFYKNQSKATQKLLDALLLTDSQTALLVTS